MWLTHGVSDIYLLKEQEKRFLPVTLSPITWTKVANYIPELLSI